MKKTNFFKMVMTLVMAFAFSGASAQILTNYVETAAGVEIEDSVTEGATTRLYVMPDAIYSPDYDATDNTGLDASAEWTWYDSNDGSTSGTIIKPAENENWIELTHGDTEGGTSYPVSVEESNTAGGCTGASQTVTIRVLNTPTVDFTDTDGSPVLGSNGSPFTFCDGDGRLSDYPQATLTGDVANTPSYQIQYTVAKDTSHSAGATWTSVGNAFPEEFLGSAGDQVDAGDGSTYDFAQPTGGFVVFDDAGTEYPTRYTYTISGVTDRISRKSDYLAYVAANGDGAAYNATWTGWTWYDTGAKTLVVIVNPTPVTGPIYHIENDWAN